MTDIKAEQVIEDKVVATLALEKSLADTEAELMQNEQFRNFLTMQKETKEKIANTWASVRQQMIEDTTLKVLRATGAA